MPTTLRYYKDKEKLRQYRQRNNARYYGRNKDNLFNEGNSWSAEETKRVLFAPKTDYELSVELGRSIRAIQIRRTRAKKHIEDFTD